MIDSHCHLEFRQFDSDRDEIIAEAKRRLVAVVDSCARIEDSSKVLDLHRSNPDFIFPTLGIHPTGASKSSNKEIERYKENVRKNSSEIVAIGEVGLDNYHIKDSHHRKKCRKIFNDFIDLSNSLDLPLVVHSRDSTKEVMELLKKKDGDVIIHCFSGNTNDLEEALDRNYYISLGGIIFRSEEKYKNIIENLPLENLLLETDSPFLAKKKSDRSTPWFIEDIADRIAEIKDLGRSEIWSCAGKNAKKVYGLPVRI